MLAQTRKDKILEMLKEDGSVKVAELSKIFKVSDVTIRQDLEKLEQDGLVTRKHGGAFLKTIGKQVQNFALANLINMDKKELIGKKAAEYIDSGDTIILDSGTTTTEIAKAIIDKQNITVITNAINIVDGIDGLATGISFFAAVSMGVLAFLSSQFLLVLIIAVLSGVIIGFYPFNFPKAKLYLGDSGSLVIGFILALLSMAAIQRKASLAIVLLIPIIILFLPILETVITIIRRVYKKQNIFTKDMGHFHYRFLQKKISETKTTLILTSISFLFSICGVLFEYVNTEIRILLLVFIFVVCFVLLKFLGYIKLKPNSKKST